MSSCDNTLNDANTIAFGVGVGGQIYRRKVAFVAILAAELVGEFANSKKRVLLVCHRES